MASPVKQRRITVKLKRPNPLFERWLTEWHDKAIENESKMQHSFANALKTLKKYPIPLQSARDCIILKGFGSKICEMLNNKLIEYEKNGDDANDENQPTSPKTRNKRKERTKKSGKSPKCGKSYTPVHRSGGYAILLALLRKSKENNFFGSVRKCDIVDYARDLCDKSFVKPDTGSFYTAWSSMSTLINKGLVNKLGSPATYCLTENGQDIANKLFENTRNSTNENCYKDNTTSTTNQNSHKNNTKNSTNENDNLTNTNYLSDIIETNATISSKHKPSSKTVHSSSQVSSLTNEKHCSSVENTIVFAAYTFEVILLVDTQETAGILYKKMYSSIQENDLPKIVQNNVQNYVEPVLHSSKVSFKIGVRKMRVVSLFCNSCHAVDDETLNELNKLNVNYEIRHLKVGDFAWICREKTTKDELMLPYIVERKRIDDLGYSIKDGRFHEQKFRLKQCGIQHLMYIVESYNNNTRTGLPLSTLMQAATNTLIQDRFLLKFTENRRHSMQYLSGFTDLLTKLYKSKTLMSSAKNNLCKSSITDDLVSLMTFTDFNKNASKAHNFKVHEIFVRQLLQLNGVSIDKALAIVNKYPTPRLLIDEYYKIGQLGDTLLSNIQYGPQKRSIGPAISHTIHQLYSLLNFP